MNSTKQIILFDGECNFCSFWVKYVIKKDQKEVFRFASLQSPIGNELLRKYQVNLKLDTVVLIENNKVYLKSTAALRILKTLGGVLSFFYIFIVTPKFIRDFFYDVIASVSYKLFRKESCQFPTNLHDTKRFL